MIFDLIRRFRQNRIENKLSKLYGAKFRMNEENREYQALLDEIKKLESKMKSTYK